MIFVVKKIEVDFIRPALLDDQIRVDSTIESICGASVIFMQQIYNQNQNFVCVQAQVKVACLNSKFKPIKLPKMLKIALQDDDQS